VSDASWFRRFTIAAVVVVATGIVFYFGHRPVEAWLFRGPEYHAVFKTAGGLEMGDAVRYGGVPVGFVRSVAIDTADPSRILVTFRVNRGTPMRSDVRASIIDLTSAVTRYLALQPGSRAAPPLAPGDSVGVTSGPTIEESMLHLTTVLARTDTLLTAMDPLVHDSVFGRIAQTTVRLDELTTAVMRSAHLYGPHLAVSVARVDTLMQHASGVVAALDSATPQIRAATLDGLAMIRDGHALIGELRQGTEEGGGLTALMRDLTEAGENMAEMSERLNRDPASLLTRHKVAAKTVGPPIE
jgi:phospholipid/cholesterol/gamma-HCH transport system substrate-binding protein